MTPVQPVGEPKIVWRGNVGGVERTLAVREVYEGPLVDPVTGEALPGSHAIIWRLTLSASDGTELEGWWDPRARTLGMHLEGWSMVAIGALKSHLIKLGDHP